MKVADFVEGFLHRQGVRHVFEVVGGMTAHLIDSIHRGGRIRLVTMRHEQAAGFAADASARLTGVPGVALATSGPGATNLLTAVGSCYFDSSPAVFITGQVNRHEQKRDRPIRQLGFQETDIVSMVAPITKAAWAVASPEDVPASLERAFATALAGRPGPVLLEIPLDVQTSRLKGASPTPVKEPAGSGPDAHGLELLLADLRAAQRPLLLVGGGVRAARAGELFRSFAERLGVPVVNSLLAVDALPGGHPLRVGMIGTYGNRWANLAVGRSDVIVVIGSRLDIRQTGADTAAFAEGRTIHHVDCDLGEINNRVQGCRPVVADIAAFLEAALACLDDVEPTDAATPWLAELAQLRSAWPDTGELNGIPGINPNELMHRLAAVSGSAAAFVCDVGQHQMWAAQSLDLLPHQRFVTSGGMGAMGYGLPAAIGAAFACEGRPIVLIAGDGGFQLNLQELQTVAHDGLPIKAVVIDNGCHGMVRQFQESYFEGRYASTVWGYSAPDFARVAEAFGIDAFTVEDDSTADEGLRRLWDDPGAPYLLVVRVDTFANAYPKIAFGRPITEMEPFATPIAMEGA